MDLQFMFRIIVILFSVGQTISRPRSTTKRPLGDDARLSEDIEMRMLGELGHKYVPNTASEWRAAFNRLLERYDVQDKKMARYELDLGVRDAGEAAKKIINKRHVNFTQKTQKPPSINPDDGGSVEYYLNFQRDMCYQAYRQFAKLGSLDDIYVESDCEKCTGKPQEDPMKTKKWYQWLLPIPGK